MEWFRDSIKEVLLMYKNRVMSKHMFFKPYKGPLFEIDGFLGKRILVVGASFYCKNHIDEQHSPCPFFKECTDRTRRDSSLFDSKCPLYTPRYNLSDSPTKEIMDGGTAYVKFGNMLASHFPGSQYRGWKDVFDCISFTNYIQFVLPEMLTTAGDIKGEADRQAFYEALDCTSADIVIVWGCVVNQPITQLAIDKELLQQSGGYLCHIKYRGKNISVINSYHPSSFRCYQDESKRLFFEALDIALKE